MNRALHLVPLFLVAGCEFADGSAATVALEARGATPTTFVDGTYSIVLHRAELAFGPAYACESRDAELCESAVLETLDVHPIDALDPTVQSLGELRGLAGEVHTIAYDLGVAFLLAAPSPEPLPGSIDGHSVVIEGTASDGVTAFDFVATVDVVSADAGETAVVGMPAEADVPARGGSLTIEVDASAWLVGLDWGALAATPRGPSEPVLIAAGTAGYEALVARIRAGAPPTFVWSTAP